MFERKKGTEAPIIEEPEKMSSEELRGVSGTAFKNKKGGCPSCHSTAYTPCSDGKRICKKCKTPYYPD